MELITIKLIIVVISLIALLLIKPIVKFCMRDKYKTYKDNQGKDVKIKTRGYIN